MTTAIQPFRIDIDAGVIDDLYQRLRAFRGPPVIEDRGWDDGVDLRYLAELIDHWLHRFDWRVQEAALNRHRHFMADIGGARLHFVHERGLGAAPLPLILVHGWPDGFQRFDKLIPLLTDPGAHGGAAADAFDVVVPSLPGCGFSLRGPNGPPLDEFGALLHRLMSDALGYGRYGAHGGDVGAMVCDQLCRDHASIVAGVHFTNVPATRGGGGDDLSAAERDYLAQRQEFLKLGGGYMHLQGTKPWTPAVALNDSPAGLAAWIVEKLQAWSDCGGDVEQRFTKDEILTNVMLYWITQSIGTSFLGYRDLAKPRHGAPLQASDEHRSRGAVAGFAMFPHDIANAPREWAERFYDVRHWSEMPSGGHFAAWEEPGLLAEDIRTFFRPLR